MTALFPDDGALSNVKGEPTNTQEKRLTARDIPFSFLSTSLREWLANLELIAPGNVNGEIIKSTLHRRINSQLRTSTLH